MVIENDILNMDDELFSAEMEAQFLLGDIWDKGLKIVQLIRLMNSLRFKELYKATAAEVFDDIEHLLDMKAKVFRMTRNDPFMEKAFEAFSKNRIEVAQSLYQWTWQRIHDSPELIPLLDFLSVIIGQLLDILERFYDRKKALETVQKLKAKMEAENEEKAE